MQPFNKSKLNLAYSLLIIALWAAIVLFYLGPKSNSILDNTFVMFLLTRYVGLWSGIIVLLLRLLRVIKDKHSFIYVFIGLLNIGLGILSIVLFAINKMNIPLFHMFILNLSIGVIIYIDIFFSEIIFNNCPKK